MLVVEHSCAHDNVTVAIDVFGDTVHHQVGTVSEGVLEPWAHERLSTTILMSLLALGWLRTSLTMRGMSITRRVGLVGVSIQTSEVSLRIAALTRSLTSASGPSISTKLVWMPCETVATLVK